MARIWEIDIVRGAAVAMMLVFHFLWDLNYFGFTHLELFSGFWGFFQKTIVTIFLLVVGAMLAINSSKNPGEFSGKFLKRGLTIFGIGIVITLVTFTLFPNEFIYFGILHLIGLSVVLSIPFAGRKNLSLALGLGLIILSLIFNLQSLNIGYLAWLGLGKPSPTLDYEPLFPLFGIVLIGIWAGNKFYPNGKAALSVQKPNLKIVGLLELFGKNSLLIYLCHQPILFSLVWFVRILAVN